MDYSISIKNSLELKEELKLKCGEIYVNRNKQNAVVLICTICKEQYLSLECFSKHIFGEHFGDLDMYANELNQSKFIRDEKIFALKYPNGQISENEDQKSNEVKYRPSSESNHDFEKTISVSPSLHHFFSEDKFQDEEKNLKRMKQNTRKSRKRKIPEGYFKCTICSELLKKEEKLEHLKTHKQSKRFICETCGKGCKNSYQLRQHLKNHTGERPYKCQFCLATFKCKHTLKGHERSHLDYKPFKCSVCEMLFKSKRTAQQHELRHQASAETNFECDLCGKKFNTLTKMTEHRGRHKEEKKPFQCPKCPKSFQSKYACTAHERLEHKGEYNYKCNFCDKLFIKIAMKKSHESTHTRVGQPFPCNLCQKKYATREGLYKHKKRDHVSDKPLPDLKCYKCDKLFKSQSEYAEHCRKHALEEYQFICSECGANFVNEINLKNHINIIHKSASKS